MIEEMFLLSKKGIAIDFMHEFVDYRAADSYHIDLNEILTKMRKLTKKINIRMDYLDYECMLHLYKYIK